VPPRDAEGALVEDGELRYEDGPSTEASVVIDAPAARVWELVVDVQLPARFSSEFRGAAWLDPDGTARLGARFVGRNRHPARGDWETTSTITAFEPGQVFGWAVGDPDHPSASWRFTLSPHDGATRLAQWMRMGPAPSGITPAIEAMPDKESRILHRRLAEHRANMEATLAGIKALAEATGD
jgi:uncharacterized protein YndB with AHSA1/START domain